MHRAMIKLKAVTQYCVLLCLLTVQGTQAEEQDSGDRVPLYDDLGVYHYEISSEEPLAQQYFDQGMRLYYAFNHSEAIRAFRAAQQIDADCAICWWGEALAWGPNINLPMDKPSAQAAYAAIEQAMQRSDSASESERALIAALATRYAADAPEDRASLDQDYADAMAELVDRFPLDLDVAVLFAEARLDLRPWDYWDENRQPQPGIGEALDQLQRVINTDETHPGACHFYIHAVEAVYPERAVDCAERLAKLMPGAGHLVHMPGHIYIRIGRYLDAVQANTHAVHADENYIRDQQPGMGMYTVGYYPHNYDFMAFAAMMIGRSELAVESAEQVTALLPEEMFGSPGMDFLQHWSVRPLLMRIRFAQWQAIKDVPAPSEIYPHAVAMWHYAQGRASLALNDVASAESHLAALREIAKSPDLEGLRMEFNQSRQLLAIAETVLTGWRDATIGDHESAIATLGKAVRLEDELFYGEPPEWSVPTRQELGKILLLAGEGGSAEQVFMEDLAKFPENGWSLYGLYKALQMQGQTAGANAALDQWRSVWSTADVEMAEIF